MNYHSRHRQHKGNLKIKMAQKTIAIIKALVKKGAIFYLNDSGGKDSQVTKIIMSGLVPDNQLVTIHAHLPGVEWKGTSAHAKKYTVGQYIEVKANKTFFEMVDHRQMWPSPKNRQCTSDLKRGPIEKAIRAHVKETGNKLVVNCMGLRAEESSSRAKAKIFKFNHRNSKAGRTWYDLLPIHELTTIQVFSIIKKAAQEPHWAYKKGMSRLSCCFCIMASKHDLQIAANLNPELYKKYLRMERKINQTLLMPSKTAGRRFLDEALK